MSVAALAGAAVPARVVTAAAGAKRRSSCTPTSMHFSQQQQRKRCPLALPHTRTRRPTAAAAAAAADSNSGIVSENDMRATRQAILKVGAVQVELSVTPSLKAPGFNP